MGSLAIVVTRDIVAPSVPTGLLATPISSSQINLSWTASTDTGGSGLKGYNVYRDGSLLISQITTNTYQDTGLNSFQTYAYRVSSVDNATNESAQSTQASAQTPDLAAPSVPTGLSATAVSSSQINLSWTGSTDTGGSGLKSYKVYRNGSLISSPAVTSLSDTGLTASTAYTYRVSAIDNSLNESAQSVQAGATTQSGGAVTALQDWTNRSNPANGVIQAIRFGGSAANVTAWKHPDSMQGNVTWDPAGGIIGDGALKILVTNADQANSGNWRAPLNSAWASLSNQNFGIGNQDIYIQYRFFYGAGRLTPAPGGGGNKIGITGGYTPSSPGSSSSDIDCEFVQSSPNYIYPWGYHHDGRNGLPQNVDTTTDWNPPAPSPLDQFGHFLQNAIDNGSSLDTAHRYAIYESSSTPVSPGVYKYQEGVPYTLMVHLHIHSYNSGVFDALNHYEEWIAKDGDTQWTKLHDIQGFAQQAGANDGSLQAAPFGPQGQWFTPYDTGRTSGVANTSQSYDQLIVSTNIIALPAVALSASSSWAPASPAPAWWTALADKQWKAPLSNSLQSVADPLSGSASQNAQNTGFHAVIDAYGGMALDAVTGTGCLPGMGGHNDYGGNEVYTYDLKVANPAWSRRRNATQGTNDNTNHRNWSDGRPSSCHGYDMPMSAEGRHFSASRAGVNYIGGGSGRNSLWEFRAPTPGLDNVNNDWTDYGNPLSGGNGTQDGWCGYDPANRWLVYVGGGSVTPSVQAFSLASNMALVASNNSPMADSNYYMGSLDTVNRIILIRNDSGWFWFPLYAISSGGVWHSISPSGINTDSVTGFVWHSQSAAFLCWNNNQLVKIKPTISGGASPTYTALAGTAVGGLTGPTPPLPNPGNQHMYGRCKIVNDMGDGRSALVVLPVFGNPDLYVLPLPVIGV